jgi:hypothetical protein
MIHRQPGMRRGVEESMRLACAPLLAFLIAGPSELASAGEFDRSAFPAATADPAPCGGYGAGVGVRKGSSDCRRISGYIAAGARFGSDDEIGGRPSPFGSLDAPEFVGGARSSGVTIIDAPGGHERIFLAPGPADEAR